MIPVTVGVDRQARRHVGGTARRALLRCARRIARALGLHAGIDVHVVSDAAMMRLHARHLGVAKATDVLSFPPLPDEPDAPGQIALDADAVARQAAGGAWIDEACTLLVHAGAHLAGHDHDTPARARRMLAAERRVARRIGLPPPRRPYGGDRG